MCFFEENTDSFVFIWSRRRRHFAVPKSSRRTRPLSRHVRHQDQEERARHTASLPRRRWAARAVPSGQPPTACAPCSPPLWPASPAPQRSSQGSAQSSPAGWLPLPGTRTRARCRSNPRGCRRSLPDLLPRALTTQSSCGLPAPEDE